MAAPDDYMLMPLSAVRALAGQGTSDFQVFLPSSSDEGPVLYRCTESGSDLPDLSRLKEHGVSALYVRSDDFDRCEEALESNLSAILQNKSIPPSDKAEVVHSVGASIAHDLVYGAADAGQVARSSSLLDNVMNAVLDDERVAGHLLAMAGHERGTASHMVMVSTLAVTLGIEIFGNDRELLRDLGCAGMLHDLGKLSIPQRILTKDGALTRDEIALVQQHPVESVRLVTGNEQVTTNAQQMILQHHERIDGRGYPVGMAGSEMLPGSKVLVIVDAFHAMVGKRSYRSAMTMEAANRALMTQAGKQFDEKYLKAWVSLCQRCDVGEGAIKKSVQPALEDETFTKHEHRPKSPPPKVAEQRQPRHLCRGNTMVRCLQVGRLVGEEKNSSEFIALVYDISRAGVCLYLAGPMYRGEVVNICMPVNQKAVWMRSVVAWCRQQNADVFMTGLRFVKRITDDQIHESVPICTMEEVGLALGMVKPEPAEKAQTTKKPMAEPSTMSKHEHSLARLGAIQSLRKFDLDAQRTVVTLAMSGDNGVRLKAIDLLMTMNTAMARDALVSLIQDTNFEIRERVMLIAGSLRIIPAVDPLRNLLKDENLKLALRAAAALGRMEDRSGLRLAVKTLDSKLPEARLAAQVVGEITGHKFAANREGIKAAKRYIDGKKLLSV